MSHYNTMLIFNQSKAGLNLKFSFSKIGCHFKDKDYNLLFYFNESWREKKWSHTFYKGIGAKWNTNSFNQNSNHILFRMHAQFQEVSKTCSAWFAVKIFPSIK